MIQQKCLVSKGRTPLRGDLARDTLLGNAEEVVWTLYRANETPAWNMSYGMVLASPHRATCFVEVQGIALKCKQIVVKKSLPL